VFATYVHDLSPVILRIGDAFALRWYGLSYLAGFLAAFWVLRLLARRGLWVLPAREVSDFIAMAALFGVFLGGRLGYLFFYHLPKAGWDELAQDPLLPLKVWEGGMASHGGVIGLMLFTWWYARRKKVSWTGLGDGLCVGAPIGLFCGRLANFINGELYGRSTTVPWAVKFPGAFMDRKLPEYQAYEPALQAAREASPELAREVAGLPGGACFEPLLEAIRRDPQVARSVEPFLEPRHPSQIYEALLEGAVLFAILFWVRLRFPKLPHGIITGLFFLLYAVFRIFVENFREPDAALVGPLTKGQFLSLFMLLAGAAFVVAALRRGRPLSASE
jgi:phosphatidylglycerol:prolipoprotein diacylglycerol transferase